jgi:hypothetical protein
MDDTMKVEFPLGPRAVVLSRPTEGQLFAITILRMPRDGDDAKTRHRFLERIIRFLEVLAGPEQWSEIEDALLSEQVKPEELLGLFSDVTQFDWAAHDAHVRPSPRPEDEPEPERRAPRVVSGG